MVGVYLPNLLLSPRAIGPGPMQELPPHFSAYPFSSSSIFFDSQAEPRRYLKWAHSDQPERAMGPRPCSHASFRRNGSLLSVTQRRASASSRLQHRLSVAGVLASRVYSLGSAWSATTNRRVASADCVEHARLGSLSARARGQARTVRHSQAHAMAVPARPDRTGQFDGAVGSPCQRHSVTKQVS